MSLLLFASTLQADIYQWRDKDGNLHFGDKPPAEAQTKKVKLKINSYQSVQLGDNPLAQDNSTSNKGKSAKDKPRSRKVVMYSASWCGVCKKAKRYFRQNHIAYSDYDVEKSEKGRRDFAAMGATGVPVILVGRQRMQGFSISHFKQMYEAK